MKQTTKMDTEIKANQKINKLEKGAKATALEIGELHLHIDLAKYPDLQSDWKKLSKRTCQDINNIFRDIIGENIRLPRAEYIEQITQNFCEHRVILLTGESGCGKSVTGKLWAKTVQESYSLQWWNAETFDKANFEELGNDLQHPLEELLETVSGKTAYFIIDNLDRLFNESSFRNLSIFLKILNLNKEDSPWRVLLTCQSQELKRISDELRSVNVPTSNWHIINMESPTLKELEPVWQNYPKLCSLLSKDKLKPLLILPKHLDTIIKNLDLLPDTRQWVGESDFIQWVWDSKISRLPEENKAECIIFLLHLAQIQGDKLITGVPLSEFRDLTVCDTLKKEHLCIITEKAAFAHDLYGDWVRQRVLLVQQHNLIEFLKTRMESPLWHRALRLFSLHILEQNSDISKWKAFLHAFTVDEQNQDILQDIFLEAAIHTPDAVSILEKIWDELCHEQGKLLHRLLVRFLFVATLPNQQILKFIPKEYELETSAQYRIPNPTYWPSVIRFLHSHHEQVIELAHNQVVQIAEKWLLQDKNSRHLCKEAAELGIEAAWHVFKLKQKNYGWSDEAKNAYRAALASIIELPEQSVEFILTACGRKEPILPLPPEPEYDDDHFFPMEDIPPWPDGPKWKVDYDFSELCLNNQDVLMPMMFLRPEIAKEVILALLIQEPGKRPINWREDPFYKDYELIDQHGPRWFPPFYNNGPFQLFLLINQKNGLDLILHLVNFATERWKDAWKDKPDEIPSVTIPFIDGEKQWFGDRWMYFTYRDSTLFPDLIVSAMMALEQWFYTSLDNNESVSDAIDMIIRSTQSLAFAGLLIGIGKKHPELFKGPLKPFLTVPEFYRWEMIHQADGEGHQMIGWNTLRHTENQIKQAQEWQNMPHRKLELSTVSHSLFLYDDEIRKFINKVRKQWDIQYQDSSPDDPMYNRLAKLLREFDANNWKQDNHPKLGTVWQFCPPKDFLEQRENALQEIDDRQLLLMFPFQCHDRLRKNQLLEPDQLNDFWDTLQHISQFTDERLQKLCQLPKDKEFGILDNPDINKGIIKAQDSLCAGSAVLILLHREWLREHPDKEEWCIQKLAETILSPPAPRPFDNEVVMNDMCWDGFCAHALPVLWAEEPTSGILRELIARLAIGYHYNTVRILIFQTAKYRQHLGDDFLRLQHLILRWAWARWELNTNLNRKESYRKKVTKKIEKIFQAFINGSLSTEIPQWDKLALINTKPNNYKHNHQHIAYYRKSPELDIGLIRHAFDGLPPINEARNLDEKQQWITFWKEALHCVLRMLNYEADEDIEIDGMPYEFDRWVFQKIVKVILQLNSQQDQKTFWEPILNMGSCAHHWIDNFLLHWFGYLLEPDTDEDMFIQAWQDMLDFAFSSPKWDYSKVNRTHYLDELWCRLMGLDGTFPNLWDENKTTLVTQMRDYYKQWAPLNLLQSHISRNFIYFLQKPAAREIRMDGLLLIDQAIYTMKNDFWYDPNDEIQKRLARLLNFYWQNDQLAVQQSQSHWDAFKRLLKILVQKQSSIALELSELISSESTK